MPKPELQLEAISQSITQIVQAMTPAILRLGDSFRELAETVSIALVRVHPLVIRLTVTQRLEIGGWHAVDPHELTPDERWEYQRWVMSAPARWANGMRQQWFNF